MRSMRILIRFSAALLVAVAATVLAGGSASAGGPTSVLVANPAADATGSLYRSDPDYDVLRRALDTARTGEPAPPAMREGPGSPSTINVAWLIHDVNVWRVDRINVHSDGTAWVRTYDALAEGTAGIDWDSRPEWRRVADSAALVAVLDRIGVLNPAGLPEQATTGAAGSDDAAGVPARTSGASWWWAAPVAALGLVLGLLSRPYLARMASGRAG